MVKPTPPLLAALADLLASPDPVSFYDAAHLVRQLRGDPPDVVLQGLVALHDSENTTDGARAVLAGTLRAAALRLDNQRLRAAGSITGRDHGKVARAPLGHTLELHLEERRGAGYRWEAVSIRGGQLRRSDRSHDAPDVAVFELKLQQAGTFTIELAERPPRGNAAPAHGPGRSFSLTVVVEG